VRRQTIWITPREVEILRLIGAGLADKQIAARLGISHRTVGTHLERLFVRLNVHSRSQALSWYRDAVEEQRRGSSSARLSQGPPDAGTRSR
jgi:DNA-binding CsgD family transcriptional regulator